VPRRTRPLRRGITANANKAEAFRPKILQLVQHHSIFAPVPHQTREALIDELVHAVGFAKLGLAELVAGKQSKPTARTLDIFTKDVCDVLRRARRRVTMNPNPRASRAQSFVVELARAVGLPGVGHMFKQMQRERKIEKQAVPQDTLLRQDAEARACSSSVNGTSD